MRTLARIATPTLAAAALFGFVGNAMADAAVPAAATAMPAAASASASSLTQGFEFVNNSHYPMTLAGIDRPGDGDGTPAIGTVLQPGQSLRYEKVFWFFGTTDTSLRFTTPMEGNVINGYEITLGIEKYVNVPLAWVFNSPDQPINMHVAREGNLTKVIAQDTTAQTITLTGQQAQQQADLMNRLCGSTSASCTFERTKDRTTAPDREVVLDRGANGMETARSFTSSRTAVASATSSVELTASAKSSVLSAVELTVSGKYGQSFTHSDTQMESRTYSISPHYIGMLYASMPMVRDQGNFVIKLGNTTWILQDVSFDSLDGTRSISYDSAERRMTDDELAKYRGKLDKYYPPAGQGGI